MKNLLPLLLLACAFFAGCSNSADVEDGIPALKNLTGTWRTGQGNDTAHIAILADNPSALVVNGIGYDGVSYQGKTVSGKRETFADGKWVQTVSYTMVTIDSFTSKGTYSHYSDAGAVLSSTQSTGSGSRVK